MNIANQLKKLRQEKGLSQAELASLLNSTQKTISFWEKGVNIPSKENLTLICEKLNINKSYFQDNNIIRIGSRLKQLREFMGDSQDTFAKKLGISLKAYWNYENDERSMPSEMLYNIIRLYGINTNWLLTGDGEMLLSRYNVLESIASGEQKCFCYNLPVRGEVEASCGFGVTVYNEEQTATYSVSKKFIDDLKINPKTSEIIFARGDSMESTIYGGDSVLVDRSKTDIQDGVIYCINLDGQIMIKRLQKIARDIVGLISDNPKYKTREIDLKQDSDTFKIIGEVRWWGRIAK